MSIPQTHHTLHAATCSAWRQLVNGHPMIGSISDQYPPFRRLQALSIALHATDKSVCRTELDTLLAPVTWPPQDWLDECLIHLLEVHSWQDGHAPYSPLRGATQQMIGAKLRLLRWMLEVAPTTPLWAGLSLALGRYELANKEPGGFWSSRRQQAVGYITSAHAQFTEHGPAKSDPAKSDDEWWNRGLRQLANRARLFTLVETTRRWPQPIGRCPQMSLCLAIKSDDQASPGEIWLANAVLNGWMPRWWLRWMLTSHLLDGSMFRLPHYR